MIIEHWVNPRFLKNEELYLLEDIILDNNFKLTEFKIPNNNSEKNYDIIHEHKHYSFVYQKDMKCIFSISEKYNTTNPTGQYETPKDSIRINCFPNSKEVPYKTVFCLSFIEIQQYFREWLTNLKLYIEQDGV
jgi:hypothetical protein